MNSGRFLSQGRRFVVAGGGRAVADGVLFLNGTVVVQSRHEAGVTVYSGGITTLPPTMQTAVEWIDALRPTVPEATQ